MIYFNFKGELTLISTHVLACYIAWSN